MRIVVELAPSRNRDALEEVLRSIRDFVDTVFFPEAPLGIPMVLAVAWAWIARSMGFHSIASVRLCDVNLNALVSIARAAELLELEGILIVRGDPPKHGRCVAEIGSEEAIEILRRYVRRLRLGLVVSMAKSLEEIETRLRRARPSFVFVTRLWSKDPKLVEVSKRCRELGTELYPYVVVAPTEEERMRIYNLLQGHQPVYLPNEVPNIVDELEPYVDGIVLTAPGYPKTLVEALRILSRR